MVKSPEKFLWFLLYVIYPFQHVSLFGVSSLKPYYLLMIFLSLLSLFTLKSRRAFTLLRVYEFFLPYLLLFLWMALSVFWSLNAEASFKALLKYGIYLFAGIGIGIFVYRRTNAFSTIAYGVFLSALFVGLLYAYNLIKYGAVSFFLGEFSMKTVASIAQINVGFGGGRNIMASWFAFALTFSYPILVIKSKSMLKRISLSVLALFLLILTFFTLSRTAIGSVMLFFVLALLWKKFPLRKHLFSFFFLVFLLMAFIFLFNPLGLAMFILNRFSYAFLALSGEVEDWGTEGRLKLWKLALESFFSSPLTGSGIGALWKGEPLIEGVNNYHNIFLQFLAQIGVIGFILFLIWTFHLFRTLYVLKRHFPFISSILMVNLLIYYAKSLLMFQYFDLEIWTLIGLTCGLYLVYTKKVCLCQK